MYRHDILIKWTTGLMLIDTLVCALTFDPD